MSTIKLGDKVRFVNENLEGIVTSINGLTAGVTIEDDFEIPVPVSQIVKITGSQNAKAEEEIPVPINKASQANQGIYIAFDRVNDVLLDLKLHNSNADEILYSFYEEDKQGIRLKKSGSLALNDIQELGRYDLEKFSQWPKFHMQLLQLNKRTEKLPTPINRTIQFNTKEFHGAFKNTFFLNRQAYLFKIDEGLLPALDLKKLQQKDFTEKPQEEQLFENKKPESIVDLHIEKLVSDISSLSPTEMVAMQMEAFTKNLELAHVHKMKNIIFIHGVGNHFLKNKIRNYLGQHKQLIASYNDADMLKYGGGATEIFLT